MDASAAGRGRRGIGRTGTAGSPDGGSRTVRTSCRSSRRRLKGRHGTHAARCAGMAVWSGTGHHGRRDLRGQSVGNGGSRCRSRPCRWPAPRACTPWALLSCCCWPRRSDTGARVAVFLAGAAICTLAAGFVVAFAPPAAALGTNGQQRPRYGLKLAIGAAFSAGAVILARRPRPPTTSDGQSRLTRAARHGGPPGRSRSRRSSSPLPVPAQLSKPLPSAASKPCASA
jgi:hypothetical protein